MKQTLTIQLRTHIRTLLVAIISASVPTFAFCQIPSGPDALVKSLILKDRNANLINLLPSKPNEYMHRQFTEAFNASWANAMSHGNDGPVLDGDLITGRQTATRVTLKSASTSENGDFAMVSTNVVYLDDDGPKKPHSEVVRFFLKKENGTWKVDDINAGDLESIRTNFKKSYGK